jgi:hypothetical protein
MPIRSSVIALLLLAVTPLGTQTALGEPPSAAPMIAKSGATDPKYKGKGFEEWMAEFQTELDPEQRIEPMKALILFGANGKANEVVDVILNLLDGYPPEVITYLSEGNDEDGNDEDDDDSFRAYLKGPDLHPALETLFTNFHDVTLFRTAISGVARISHRAIPQLVQLVEEPGERTTARLTAMVLLSRRSDPVMGKLIPKLVARDDRLSEAAWEMWEQESSPEIYDTTAQALLALNDQRHTLRVIKAMTSQHPVKFDTSIPMLEKVKQTTTDPMVREAVVKTLETIQKKQEAAGLKGLSVKAVETN